MPELPEVQTVVDHLAAHLLGQTIHKVEIHWPALTHHQADFASKLEQKTLHSIHRRGKYLVFVLDEGYWIVHLRMEGKFFLNDPSDPIAKHTHACLWFDRFRLDYNDTRKFGRFDWTFDEEAFFADRLGLEPFDHRLTPSHLKSCAAKRRIPLKAFLLDQSVIAGIGNIYADESCFKAQLSPFKTARSLTLSEWEKLIEAIREVLTMALNSGGSTIRTYTVSHGVTGRFQQSLMVYGRNQEPCKVCGNLLERGIVSQRSTIYCRHCQKVSQHAHRHYGIHGQRKIHG